MSVSDSLIRRSLIAIAGLTMVTGAIQVFAPRQMLQALSADDDDTARHFFGTVGMFMVVVGGGLLNTLLTRPRSRDRVLGGAAEARRLARGRTRRAAADLLAAGAGRRGVRPALGTARRQTLAADPVSGDGARFRARPKPRR